MTVTISSAANSLVKRICLLSSTRRHRCREGAFVVEGIQPVWHAVEADWSVESPIVAPELLTRASALRMVDEQKRGGVRVARLSSDSVQVTRRPRRTADLATIVHNEIVKPGNLGTIIHPHR